MAAAKPVAPARVPSWVEDPSSWDTLLLGGVIVPGIPRLKVPRKMALDKKKSKAASGATITFQGYEAVDVDIEVRIWTPLQWQQWQELMSQIEPRPSKTFDSVAIDHPATTQRGITSVYIEQVEGPDLSPDGMGTFTIKCAAGGKPTAVNGGNAAKKDDGDGPRWGDVPVAPSVQGGNP